jgi:hypothetical protein
MNGETFDRFAAHENSRPCVRRLFFGEWREI